MVRLLRVALATMSTTSCVVADVASCQQTDETTLLQGIGRHPIAQSLQPLPDVGPQALVSDAELQPLAPGAVPDIDEMREWVANHPVVAEQIREVGSTELVDVFHHFDTAATRFPGVANAMEEWVVGGAGTPQQRVRKLIIYIRGADSAAHRNLFVERQHRKGNFNLLEKAMIEKQGAAADLPPLDEDLSSLPPPSAAGPDWDLGATPPQRDLGNAAADRKSVV